MRRLGSRLNAAATAVYWHVGGRDDLITLAADETWIEVGLPDLDWGDWRRAATAMATDLYSMITRHPWLVPAMSTHLLYGPGKARHDDHLLAVYESGGLSPDEADAASTTVFAFVLGLALGATAESAWKARLRRSRNGDQQLARALADVTETAMHYPRLQDRATPQQGGDPGHHRLTTGLRTILDGVSAAGGEHP